MEGATEEEVKVSGQRVTDALLNAGYDNLGSYAFNTKTKSHRFCKSCGTSIMIDFQRNLQGETDPAKDILAVNVC